MEIYELCGAVIFYDGIQDNTRCCLSKAMTAARHGAQVANYVEVIELVKRTAMNGTIIVSGVKVRVIDISTISSISHINYFKLYYFHLSTRIT